MMQFIPTSSKLRRVFKLIFLAKRALIGWQISIWNPISDWRSCSFIAINCINTDSFLWALVRFPQGEILNIAFCSDWPRATSNENQLWKLQNLSKGYMGDTQNFEQTVENLIDTKIEMYHNDRTGLPDYAIDTAGGTIIEYRSTLSMNSGRKKFKKQICEWVDELHNRPVIFTNLLKVRCYLYLDFRLFLIKIIQLEQFKQIILLATVGHLMEKLVIWRSNLVSLFLYHTWQ